MSAGAKGQKDSAMAANLVKKGIYHGKRMTKPYKNSGGLNNDYRQSGSAANARRLNKR